VCFVVSFIFILDKKNCQAVDLYFWSWSKGCVFRFVLRIFHRYNQRRINIYSVTTLDQSVVHFLSICQTKNVKKNQESKSRIDKDTVGVFSPLVEGLNSSQYLVQTDFVLFCGCTCTCFLFYI